MLIVEGPSDVKYLDAMSGVLELEGRDSLSPDWTKLPAGGIDRVPLFVAFLAAQEDINVAVLVDSQKRHGQLIGGLYKNKHVKKKNVLTFTQFTSTAEADMEDMFDRDFVLDLLKAEFGSELEDVGWDEMICTSRIVKDVEERIGEFNHYRIARYLSENVEGLSCEISDETKSRFEKLFRKVNALLD